MIILGNSQILLQAKEVWINHSGGGNHVGTNDNTTCSDSMKSICIT